MNDIEKQEQEMEKMKQVFRYNIPIDGQTHVIKLNGQALHVELGEDEKSVDFWAEHYERSANSEGHFYVAGTGHNIDDEDIYIGSTGRHDGLIWHLYEVYKLRENPLPTVKEPNQ